MKKNNKISPIGLKGNEINERMKELMGIGTINENKSTSEIELTKVGPDGHAYAIVRENHEYYIKTTNKTTNLVAEDFKYIGGLMNKKSEAYPSYAKAIKHLNLKFKSLAEAYNNTEYINVFENDNLLNENGFASGFSDHPKDGGFTGEGNLEGNTPLPMAENETKNNPWAICTSSVGRKDKAKFESCVKDVKKEKGIDENLLESDMEEEEEEEVELTEEEKAIDNMGKDVEEVKEETEPITEHKLSILRAIESMDAIIDGLTEGKVKKKSLYDKVTEDKRYKLKLAGSEPASSPTPAPPVDNTGFGGDTPNEPTQPASDDKPFDSEPFDAGVEADEQSDPKKFIEQLTGKLGQSLRKYNEEQGQPDLELEKFAINSLLSATHTSEMDNKDQDDIIKKVKTAGNDDNENSEEDNTNDSNAGGSDGDNVSNDFGGSVGNDNGGAAEASSQGGDVSENKAQGEMDNLFINPKKNNMFQVGSNDILKNDLKESEKNSIFVKNKIKTRLQETFNQEDMTEPMVEPAPIVKPNPDKIQPNIAPSRKNKPFLPMPAVKPDPKASK